MSLTIDSYSESNQSSASIVGDAAEGFNSGSGQSFEGDGTTLDYASLYLKTWGSPTGNAVAYIYAHTGTFGTDGKPTGDALATSDNFNVSALGSSYSLHNFTFSGINKITLENGTYYVLVLRYPDGTGNNAVNMGLDDTSPTHPGNYSYESPGAPNWGATDTKDLCFYVYGDPMSERGIYLEGEIGSVYSKEDSSSLGADDTNLEPIFTSQEYTDVGTDNDTYVDLVGSEQYFQFLFKEYNSNDNSTDNFRITWKGKSTLAPSSYTVYLQIYNRTTTSWTTLTSNSSASKDTKFTLTHDITADMSDYYDANHVISARVYQDIT